MKTSRIVSVLMGLGLVIATAPRAPGQVPTPAVPALSAAPGEKRGDENPAGAATQPAAVETPNQLGAATPPADSPQDFKILDLKSRREVFEKTRRETREITLPPDFRARKVLLRSLKIALETNAADPASEQYQKTNAAYHETFAAVARDFNDYLRRHQEKAPAMLREFSNLASAMGSAANELSTTADGLETRAAGLATQRQQMLQQLRASAEALGQVIDQNKSLTLEQQTALIEAQEAADAMAAKEKVVRKNAEDLRRQAQRVQQQLRQLLAKKGQYEKFVRNAKRAQAQLGDIVKWQNDRAKVAELQARLSSLELSGHDFEIELDLPGAELIPDQPSGPIVVEKNMEEQQALEILKAHRSPNAAGASNNPNASAHPVSTDLLKERSKQ